MAKIVLSDILGGYDLSKINDNFQKIAEQFNLKVFYRNNPEGEDNSLLTDVDVNGKNLYNVPTPATGTSVVSKQWVEDNFNATTNAAAIAAAASAAAALVSETNADVSEANALASAQAAALSEANADISESNALTAEMNAAASAAQAATYASLGLGGAAAFDFGLVADAFILFPTDWGTIV